MIVRNWTAILNFWLGQGGFSHNLKVTSLHSTASVLGRRIAERLDKLEIGERFHESSTDLYIGRSYLLQVLNLMHKVSLFRNAANVHMSAAQASPSIIDEYMSGFLSARAILLLLGIDFVSINSKLYLCDLFVVEGAPDHTIRQRSFEYEDGLIQFSMIKKGNYDHTLIWDTLHAALRNTSYLPASIPDLALCKNAKKKSFTYYRHRISYNNDFFVGEDFEAASLNFIAPNKLKQTERFVKLNTMSSSTYNRSVSNYLMHLSSQVVNLADTRLVS